MNKKVLTVCAALLLSGSSFVTINAQAGYVHQLGSWANKEGVSWTVVNGTDTTAMNLTADVEMTDQKNLLLINEKGFHLNGNGKTFKGRIVVTADDVVIENLKIDYTNVFSNTVSDENYGDGTVNENKSAITFFANNGTVRNCEISCAVGEDRFMANGISILPMSETAAFTIENNTITGANKIVSQGTTAGQAAPSFGIVIMGNSDNTYLTNGGTKYQSKNLTSFDITSLSTNKVTDSATDFGYVEVTGSGATYKENYEAVRITPLVDEQSGEITNAESIQLAIQNASEGANVIFNGDAQTLLAAVKGAEEDLQNANVAIKCNDLYVTYGEATAPEGEPAISVDGQGQASSIPLTYHKDLADGKEATNLLVVNNQEVKAYRAEGETTSTVSLGNYNPSDNTELWNRAELYQWTFEVVETQPNEYELRLKDNYGQWLTVNGKYAFVSMQASTENPDGITYNK